MISRNTERRIRYVSLGLLRASALAALVWLICAVVLGWRPASAEDFRARVLLTFIGVLVGSSVMEVINRVARIFPRSALAGFVANGLAVASYLLIVWTDLKTEAWLWRIWWLAAIAAITASHILLLRAAAAGRRGIVEKTAVTGALLVALLLASLVLRRNFLTPPPTAYLVVIGVLAPIVLTGSIIARVRVKRKQPPTPAPLWVKMGWRLGGLAALFFAGFYFGRITAPAPGLLDGDPGPLVAMSDAEIEAMVQDDLRRLHVLAAGIDELFDRADRLTAEIAAAQRAEGRTYYTPAEEDSIRSAFMSYLAYRAGLLRMAAGYGSFAGVRDPALRDRCFIVGYAAATTVMEASLALVTLYRDEPIVRRKLNEPDPQWGLPADTFERIYAAVTADRNVEAMEEMGQYFRERRADWQAGQLLPADELAWLEGRIDRSMARIAAAGIDRRQARIEQLIQRVRGDAYSPYYAAQSVISTWIGDTRLVGRPPFITHDLIRAARQRLQPGDIILERRNWFASNAFLPGFWPHAALYIGAPADLERLGVIERGGDGTWTSRHPAVRDALPRYLARVADGGTHEVIESVSEGVIFNTLEHSLHADYVAVLRPRLSDEQKAAAIARAFGHVGKPYDFEFDFFSADKLVCTELVYRAYEGSLRFDLVRIMGRNTLPALEIARKYGRERGREDRQLDFVCFLDTRPGQRCAEWSDEETFIASADRPGAFNE